MPARTYTLTYDVVTPESAELGDFADHGYGSSADDGTSLRHNIPDPGDAWTAYVNAAHDAATDRIEPDEYDLDEAEDRLTARDIPEGTVCPACDCVVSHARSCPRRTAPVPTDDEIKSAAAVAMTVRLLRAHYGATEPSSHPWTPGTWYRQPDGSIDYATGAVTRTNVHLKGFSEEEERAIYAAVVRR